MKKSGLGNKLSILYAKAICSFFITLALCSVMIIFTIINISNVEKLNMEQLILEKSSNINEIISKLLYKTHALSSFVIQTNGKLMDFERVAAAIADDPAILNILIAPNGIVSNIYPLEGNESLLGFDFFKEGAGNREAALAKELGELVFGGPFNLMQGGQALVGRLPVYLKNSDGSSYFWGLVSIGLKFPQALEGAGLELLEKKGLAYEIWRINPDNNEKQIIANSSYNYDRNARFIERHILIINANWYCRISPVSHWYEYPETWLLCFISLVVSFLVSYVMQNNTELKIVKAELEELARIDSLTGIFNRRYFMELSNMQINKSLRNNSNCFLILFDLDYFKETNDRHGHLAGDEVLKTIAHKVKDMLRSYDLFARFGGEEFIILITDVDKIGVISLTERIRLGISETLVKYESEYISVSASFGIAQATPVNDIETAIKYADAALYRAKEEGRNKTVFYDIIPEEN